MKIVCEQCGNKFDYKKHNGICSQCGRYHSHLPSRKIPHSKQAKIRRKRKGIKRGAVDRVGSIMIVCLIVIAALLYKGRVMIEQRDIRMAKEIGLLPTVSAETGDTIQLEHGTLVISDYTCFHEWDDKLPEGYKLLAVEFQYEENEADNEYYGKTSEVFICINDTFYLESLYPYEVADKVGMDSSELEEVYRIAAGIRKEGSLLFLIPAEPEKADIIIYSYQESEFVPQPQKIIKIHMDLDSILSDSMQQNSIQSGRCDKRQMVEIKI